MELISDTEKNQKHHVAKQTARSTSPSKSSRFVLIVNVTNKNPLSGVTWRIKTLPTTKKEAIGIRQCEKALLSFQKGR
jgi:hypothetical protein